MRENGFNGFNGLFQWFQWFVSMVLLPFEQGLNTLDPLILHCQCLLQRGLMVRERALQHPEHLAQTGGQALMVGFVATGA